MRLETASTLKQEGNGPIDQRASGLLWPLYYLYFCKMSGETCTIPRSEILYFLQNVGESCTIPQIDKMSGEFHHPIEISPHHF